MGHVRGIVKTKSSCEVVFDYHPKEFPIVPAETATQFVSQQQHAKTDFKISDLIAKQAGINDLERRSMDDRIEQVALEKMKEVEEKAYKEAYELGQIDGAERAFQEFQEEFSKRLESIDLILQSLERLKESLIVQNESHIVRLSYLIAKKIAVAEISEKPEMLAELLKNILESVQADERVTVKMSSEDVSFIESLKEKLKKNWDFLKNVKVEGVEGISRGGCLIETNYGSIDASLEARVDKAWDILAPKIPKVKGGTSDGHAD